MQPGLSPGAGPIPDGGFEYDLSAALVKAGTIYEKRIGNQWLLFAPDWPGWPILADDWIYELLERFRSPAAVGDILTAVSANDQTQHRTPTFEEATKLVGVLEEGGFLRDSPAELPYSAPAFTAPATPKTVSVWLHITNACNLDCAYCFVAKKDGVVMPEALSAATAERLAQTAIAHSVDKVIVKFAGGEPTLVMPAVERFRARLETALTGTGIRTHAALLSNGTRIDDRVIAFLRRPHSSISISLDGYGDAHDIYRRTRAGAPTWSIIVKNFDRLQRERINPLVMATVSDQSRRGLPKLVQWVLSRGLRTRIGVVREIGRGAGGEEASAAYASRLAESFDETFALLEAERTPVDPRHDLQICELRFDRPAYPVPCGIGSNHLVVKPDGTLASCPMTVDDPGVPVREDMLDACRQTFPFTPSARADGNGAACLSCRWFPVCVGGCPVNNAKTRGNPLARSPLCGFYQAVIPRYLEFYGRKAQERSRLQVAEGANVALQSQ